MGDDATTGLYFRHSAATGKITWVYRTRKGGAWRVEKIGQWPGVSLAAARARATALHDSVIPEAMTFGALLSEWFERRIEPRYRQTRNVGIYVAKGKAVLGSTKLTSLTTAGLVAKLKDYAKVSPVSANRCLSNWKLALAYAVECGYLQANPLDRTTARVIGGEEKSRARTLTDDEIRAMWKWPDPNAQLLRFILATGLRISEAQQGYVDGDKFRIDHTKNGSAHWVPMTPSAVANRGETETSATAVQAWLKRKVGREQCAPFVAHDLRRTFATRLAGLGVPPHVIEKCLNHRMQGVMAVYNQHDYAEERIAAARLWSDALTRLVQE
ncbi:hypothetical protein RN01_11735 [Cupriavidus sp. SHE]|nr:hypothetical protein RN01_11735 [Cupriavidus sp. SHE]